MDKMLDFYTRILGLTPTDGGGPEGRGIFLSAHPETEHHEFLISRAPDRHTNAQQISFTIGSLDDLREMYHSIRDYGIDTFRITNHGIAIGCYFRDPENNPTEVFWVTGLPSWVGVSAPIDIDRPDDEVMADVHRVWDRVKHVPMGEKPDAETLAVIREINSGVHAGAR
jgi:catechol-2,3-dioxygenase